jgi:hypothetical protein
MVAKDRLLRRIPPVSGVAFGRVYDDGEILYARLGHAVRTTVEDERSLVIRDLAGARRVAVALAAAFR